MDLQDAKNLTISEGAVKTIHNSSGNLLWGGLGYDTKYAGDALQQTQSGKNLFKAVSRAEHYGITTTVNSDNSISVSGLSASTGINLTASFYLPTPVPAGTTLTLSFSSPAPCIIRAYCGGWIQVPAGSTSATATVANSGAYVYLAAVVANNTQYDFNVDNIQLEIGGSPTSFEPFIGATPAPSPFYPENISFSNGEQSVSISDGVLSKNYKIDLVGKNLFDQSTISTGDMRGLSPTTRLCSHQALWVPAGTYTVSTDAPSTYRYATTVNAVGAPPFPTYPTYIIDTGWKTSSSFTFTINQGGWLAILFSKGNGTSTLTIEEVQAYHWQVERNSNPTTYIPFHDPIEIRKINIYQDYIYKSGDDWYIHREIAKSNLGDLNWSYSDTAISNKYRMFTSGLSGQYVAPANNATVPDFKSNYFTAINANNNYNNYVGIASNPGGTAVYAYHPDYTATSSPSSFKTWLSDNNVVLYYALKTPTNTQITDAALIAQFEAIHEWLTRYGYQSSVSGNLPIIIKQDNL